MLIKEKMKDPSFFKFVFANFFSLSIVQDDLNIKVYYVWENLLQLFPSILIIKFPCLNDNLTTRPVEHVDI